jgi:hypothetical protein
MQWACFQGFAPPGPLAECTVANRKGFAKPLKISPRPLNAIDVVLKRMTVTEERLSLFFRSVSPQNALDPAGIID